MEETNKIEVITKWENIVRESEEEIEVILQARRFPDKESNQNRWRELTHETLNQMEQTKAEDYTLQAVRGIIRIYHATIAIEDIWNSMQWRIINIFKLEERVPMDKSLSLQCQALSKIPKIVASCPENMEEILLRLDTTLKTFAGDLRRLEVLKERVQSAVDRKLNPNKRWIRRVELEELMCIQKIMKSTQRTVRRGCLGKSESWTLTKEGDEWFRTQLKEIKKQKEGWRKLREKGFSIMQQVNDKWNVNVLKKAEKPGDYSMRCILDPAWERELFRKGNKLNWYIHIQGVSNRRLGMETLERSEEESMVRMDMKQIEYLKQKRVGLEPIEEVCLDHLKRVGLEPIEEVCLDRWRVDLEPTEVTCLGLDNERRKWKNQR